MKAICSYDVSDNCVRIVCLNQVHNFHGAKFGKPEIVRIRRETLRSGGNALLNDSIAVWKVERDRFIVLTKLRGCLCPQGHRIVVMDTAFAMAVGAQFAFREIYFAFDAYFHIVVHCWFIFAVFRPCVGSSGTLHYVKKVAQTLLVGIVNGFLRVYLEFARPVMIACPSP